MEAADSIETSQALWRVRSALRGLRDALARDNYAMEVVSFDKLELKVAVRALQGACPECLVPKAMITDLIRTQVPSEFSNCGIDVDIDIPSEWMVDVGN